MLFRIPIILAVTLYGSCMEMRETVERMVMVRTSGSDLQPAATGYIYKKKNDGEESVIEMGESEVIEHLDKYYKQPKSLHSQKQIAADIKEDEENKDAIEKERVIPVSEESEEKIDGLADDEFKKILEKYGVNFDNHENYDHYSRGLGDFDDGYYHGYGDQVNKKGYTDNQHYGSGRGGDYHNLNYEGYTHLHKDGDEKEKKDSDTQKEYADHKLDKENESEAGNNKKGLRFQNTYDNDQKGRKLYDHDDGVKFAFYKYGGGRKYHGDDYDSKIGKNNEESGAHGVNNSEEDSGGKQRHYGSEGTQTYGKTFSFEIKH